jgi:hypothetical protein
MLVDIPLQAVEQFVVKRAHDPIAQRIIVGGLPTSDVDRYPRVSPGRCPAVEPRPSVGKGDAQALWFFSRTVTGPRVVPGEPPIVGLDAERLNHLGDQCSADVARDILPR